MRAAEDAALRRAKRAALKTRKGVIAHPLFVAHLGDCLCPVASSRQPRKRIRGVIGPPPFSPGRYYFFFFAAFFAFFFAAMVIDPPFRSRNGRRLRSSINISGDKETCILGVA